MALGRRGFIGAGLAGMCLLQMRSLAVAQEQLALGLKDLFKRDFKIGTALSSATFVKKDAALLALIAREFNAITAENAMKWQPINP